MESLRVYPPVPMTVRQAAKDDELDGTFIAKNTLFYLPVRHNHFVHLLLIIMCMHARC
jgi:cytochrome P450